MRRVAVGAGAAPDVYGADLWKYKVERFSQGGVYELTYGGVAPPTGLFNEPYGVSVDAQHTFVIDTTNQRAERFNSASPYGFQLSWGVRGWGEGNPGFNWPRDLTIFPGDRVWVADTKNNRLTEFDRSGNATGRSLGSFGAALGQLNYPYALTAVGTHLIVADSKNDRVQRWDPSTGQVVWSQGGFDFPRDVTVAGGFVYVADTRNNRIVKLDAATGGPVGGAIGGGSLHGPEGVAIEPNGDIWVADTTWNRLVEFSSTGVFKQRFGGPGAGQSGFNVPAHLEIVDVGAELHLFVADVENDRIQVFRIG
jgi:DNA-binding beta-propeller fold protein YncE